MESHPVHRPTASAMDNGDFIYIQTYSGYRMYGHDPLGVQHFLPAKADDEELGLALQDALLRSRALSPEEANDLFDLERSELRYKEWISFMLQRYGYKNKRALFKNMKNCTITREGAKMIISPSIHKALDLWERRRDDHIEDVHIPFDSRPAEIGAALRLAFSRCV